MAEPEKKPSDKNFLKNMFEKESVQKKYHFFLDRRLEFLSGFFMFVGLVLSFFYLHIGSLLVGLAFGICFFAEIKNYCLMLGDLYAEQGIFKTVMLIATVIFFLITVPLFIVAAALGFGIMYLIGMTFKKGP